MNEEKTTNFQEKVIKNDIYYQLKNGEVSFFYNDFMLFRHSKNAPIVSIIIKKNNAEKEIPLQNFFIKKTGLNKYTIEFSYQIYRIGFILEFKNGILNAEVKNPESYDIIKISLKNSTGRIRGLGLNKYDNCANREFVSNGYTNNLKKYFSDDKILTFVKKKKYLFSIVGAFEWKAEFSKTMNLYIKNAYYFNIKVVFGQTIDEIEKIILKQRGEQYVLPSGKMVECSIDEVEEKLYKAQKHNEKIGTFIINDTKQNFWELAKFREKYRRTGIKIIKKIVPKISINDDYLSEFNDDDFIKNDKNKIIMEVNKDDKFLYFDLSNPDTARKVKNYVRRIFGTNIDGLFSAEKENIIYNSKSYIKKAVGMSLMWQNILNDAKNENYSPKILIFDTLSSATPFYGYFLLPRHKAIAFRRVRYIKNLRNSGVFDIMVKVGKASRLENKHIQNKLKQKVDIIY